MNAVEVKICGTTNLADARYCAARGADYLGFIQYIGSPRYVEPSFAKEIIEWVEGPRAVGVFVDENRDRVNEITTETGFDLVQLHGAETPEYCSSIEKPVIKAIRIRESDRSADVARTLAAYESAVSLFLLDTHVEGSPGGTGQVFSWELAASLSRDFPIFLAGGLNPDNVAEAVKAVKPAGVDVVSGVEEEHGRKSFEAVDRFFSALSDLGKEVDNAD